MCFLESFSRILIFLRVVTEVEINWEEICPEKYYKKEAKCTREGKVKMFRFYLQWSKVIQYAANSNKENGKPKYLQIYDKGLDMGKHTWINTIYSLHVI